MITYTEKKMTKFLTTTALGLILSTSAFANPFTVPEENLFVPHRVTQKPIVSFEEGKFSVSIDGKSSLVKPYDVSGLPKELTEEKLRSFLTQGYLSLKKVGKDVGIEGKTRGLGGGWWKDIDRWGARVGDDMRRWGKNTRENIQRTAVNAREELDRWGKRTRENIQRDWVNMRDDAVQAVKEGWLNARDTFITQGKKEWVEVRDALIEAARKTWVEATTDAAEGAAKESLVFLLKESIEGK